MDLSVIIRLKKFKIVFIHLPLFNLNKIFKKTGFGDRGLGIGGGCSGKNLMRVEDYGIKVLF